MTVQSNIPGRAVGAPRDVLADPIKRALLLDFLASIDAHSDGQLTTDRMYELLHVMVSGAPNARVTFVGCPRCIGGAIHPMDIPGGYCFDCREWTTGDVEI